MLILTSQPCHSGLLHFQIKVMMRKYSPHQEYAMVFINHDIQWEWEWAQKKKLKGKKNRFHILVSDSCFIFLYDTFSESNIHTFHWTALLLANSNVLFCLCRKKKQHIFSSQNLESCEKQLSYISV